MTRNGLKIALLAGLVLPWLQPTAWAEDKSELKDEKAKVSYSVGIQIGNNLKRSGYEVDVDVMANAIKDIIAGREPKLTEQQARDVLAAYQKELMAKREEERKKTAEKNKQEGEAFLAENKKKPGVKTQMVTLPDGTSAELQYKVITEGTGPMPKSNDVVTVNYRGTLINGKEFDSSTKNGGQPLKRPANSLIRGWTEALQMMKVGSKWELYLPASLAYNDRAAGPLIEPGSTLIFEMELLNTEAPPAPQPAQPLTSDIIRVPSAEELKAGKKVEVIKAEDLEKIKNEGQTNKTEKKP